MVFKPMILTAAAITIVGAPAASFAQSFDHGHAASYRGQQARGVWRAPFAPGPGFWDDHNPYHSYRAYRPYGWGRGYHRLAWRR